MRRSGTFVAGVLAVAALSAAPCPKAWASEGSTDYVVTTPSGLYESPPGNASTVGLTQQYQGKLVGLPFTFLYWGVPYSSMWATPTGFACFGVSALQGATAGQPSNGLMASVTQLDDWDGMCAPEWDNIYYGTVYYWTAGTAPNRRFIVSWENFTNSTITNEHLYFQFKLFETSNQVQFAYKPDANPSTWILNRYNCGMVAPGTDPRWIAATSDNNVQTGHPLSDYQFTPRPVHHVGTLLFDRFVPTSGGIPATATADAPLGGIRLELRLSDGSVVGFVYTAADGSFDVTCPAGPTALPGELWAVSSSVPCVVKDASQASPASLRVATGVSLANDQTLGAVRVTTTTDPTAAFRAPAAVVSSIFRVYAWATALTGDSIPQLAVSYDTTSVASTNYAGGTSPTLRIAGPASANPDAWDEPVVIKAYSRHILASIAVAGSAYDDRFDVATDVQNAFAEGFGYYVYAAITGNSHFIDGVGATSATDVDLENPTIAGAKGPDVAGCVAGAIYDVLDGANESIDRIDGTSTPSRIFHLIDAFASPPTASTFFDALVAAGYDASTVVRLYVGNGLLPDDPSEPNDSRAEATAFGPIAQRRTGFFLNRFNEDWFSATLPGAAASLHADVSFNRSTSGTEIVLEIRDGSGALLATGSASGALAPFRAATDALGPGTYYVAVRWLSGIAVPTYSLQVCEPLVVAAAPLADWTVGQPYDRPLGLAGGIAPFGVDTANSSLLPGVGFNSISRHVAGTPTTAGTYPVVLVVQDGGNPANVVTISQTITIHEAVKIPVPQYVGFPADRALDVEFPVTGGTPPVLLALATGALPSGLTLDTHTRHVTGTATPSSATLTLDAVDAAGSADHVVTRAVAAVQLVGKNVATPLAAGADVCGWWFDAVEGSTVTFAVSTAKGQPKRDLAITMLAPDRSVATGGTAKTKSGTITLSKFVCPQSGRFYVVVSSDSGDATQLLGNLVLAPPKSGKSTLAAFLPSVPKSVEIGAIAGAKLTFKYKGDKKAGLALKIASLFDPTGKSVPVSSVEVSAGKGATFSTMLATGGTWTIVLASQKTSGSAGKATYSYSIKQPKKTAYSAD